jgi:hypothetical protein
MDAIYNSNNVEEIIRYLQQRELLRSNMLCSKCEVEMRWEVKSDGDGYVWRCQDCHTTRTIRADSFFETSKLSLPQLMKAMFYFVEDAKIATTAKTIKVYRTTLSDFHHRLRYTFS